VKGSIPKSSACQSSIYSIQDIAHHFFPALYADKVGILRQAVLSGLQPALVTNVELILLVVRASDPRASTIVQTHSVIELKRERSIEPKRL